LRGAQHPISQHLPQTCGFRASKLSNTRRIELPTLFVACGIK
jgi:hypothetical protein